MSNECKCILQRDYQPTMNTPLEKLAASVL